MFPKIEIVSIDEPFVTGAAIEIPGRAEPIFVLPFPKHGLEKAFALSEHVVLFATDGDYPTQCYAKYDVRAERIIQSTKLIVRGRAKECQLSGDRGLLYCIGPHAGITVIDVETLTIWRSFDALVLEEGKSGKLVKLADDPQLTDRLMQNDPNVLDLSTRHFYCDRGPKQLVFLNNHVERVGSEKKAWRQSLCEADIDVNSVSCVDVMRGVEGDEYRRGISFLHASDRFGLSVVADAMPISTRTGARSHQAFGYVVPDVGAHFDARPDGVMRFGAVLDYWDLSCDPPRCQRHVVRMATAAELNLKYLVARNSGDDMTDLRFEKALEFQAVRLANPDNTDFAKRYSTTPRTEEHKEAVRIPLPFDIRSKALSAYIFGVFEEPGSRAYWVLFLDNSIRRVESDGTLGPLIFLYPHLPCCTQKDLEFAFDPSGTIRITRKGLGTYRFSPKDIAPGTRRIELKVTTPAAPARSYWDAFEAFVRGTTVNAVAVLKEWGPEACATALREQKLRIETEFDSLLAGPGFAESLTFGYVIGDQSYDEAQFFQRLVDERVDVVQELRELLTTYLDKINDDPAGCRPFTDGESGTPSLAHAMRTLLLLDPDSHDLFRLFLAKRDAEHECYCRETIVPDYVAAHGWRDCKALRFGIFFALNLHWGGLTSDGLHCDGLLAAAAQMVSAEEFADMIVAEGVTVAKLRPMFHKVGEGYYVGYFFARLDPDNSFEAEVRAILKSRLPGLEQAAS